jgi:uncharacterized protein (DUF427 family)
MSATLSLPEENVWDYPRPPRLEPVRQVLRVIFNGVEIANTSAAHRILETSHPPTYYIPKKDVRMELLAESKGGGSFCEFKGRARYWSINADGKVSEKAAWSYPNPSQAFVDIADDLSFYASKVDECYVDDVQVMAQEGDFYGGWITPNLKGPFKGGPGTSGW